MKEKLSVLSFDQANNTGYAYIEYGKLLAYGSIKEITKPKMLLLECKDVSDGCLSLSTRFNPMLISFEDVFMGKNTDTFKRLTIIQGMLGYNFIQLDERFTVVPPKRWQSWCKFVSKVDKKLQSVERANLKFGLNLTYEQNDIADAINQADYVYNEVLIKMTPTY